MGPTVQLCNVVKDYSLGKVVVHALKETNLKLDRGEFTTIAGPSGSGKTTLLNMVGCVDVPTRGHVKIEGLETTKLSDAKLTDLRLHTIGFIFQSFNLIGVLDVFQNVEFPLLLQGGRSRTQRDLLVEEMIEKVGLREQLRQRPNELSGGQRQRVAIARALVTRPSIVLADEPTANLDSTTGRAIIDLMKEINRKDLTTFVFSTHDPEVMGRASRLIRVVDGRIESDQRTAGS